MENFKSLDGDLFLTHLTLYHLSSCRCAYYETCATYGLNVERVFQDGKETFCVSQVHDTLFDITETEDLLWINSMCTSFL